MSNNIQESGYKVLFVDDEEKTLKNFSKLISSQYQVLTATNIKDAQQILDQEYTNIGVLITDQRMPGGNGVELLTYAQNQYPEIVRLLTTAYSDLDDAITAINKGEIFKYLSKPWDINVLQVDIRTAMSYFELRKDRDTLVKEKLSVLTQSAGIDCIRHLIVIGHSHSALRYAPQAVQAFLQMLIDQKDITTNQETELDYWNLAVTETEIMNRVTNNLHSKLSTISNTRKLDEQITDSDWRSTIQDLLKPCQHELTIADNLDVLTGSKQNIVLLLEALFDLIKLFHQKETSVDINLNNSEDGSLAVIVEINHIPKLIDAGKQALNVNSNNESTDLKADYFVAWLSVFLLVYDHAGNVATKNDGASIKIALQLPNYATEPKKIMLQPNWIEDIFVDYS